MWILAKSRHYCSNNSITVTKVDDLEGRFYKEIPWITPAWKKKNYIRFFHFFPGYFSFITTLFWTYSTSSSIIPAVWVFQVSCFARATWLYMACFSLIRSYCNHALHTCDVQNHVTLKPHVFKMAAIWANKKNCSKFLFVDRIKIFADIDY